MDTLLYFVILSSISGLIYFFSFSDLIKIRKWRNDYPTKKEYLRKNTYAKTRAGIKCFVCKSTSLNNNGVISDNDPNRAISCAHCSAKLFRIEARSLDNVIG